MFEESKKNPEKKRENPDEMRKNSQVLVKNPRGKRGPMWKINSSMEL